MAGYVRGNLAVDERQIPKERVKIKETRKTAYRPSRVSQREKLVYMLAVFVVVFVCGFVVWSDSLIYQTNTRIHAVEKEIAKLEVDNSALKEKLSKMSDPEKLSSEAGQTGLKPIPDKGLVRVPPEAKGTSVRSAAGASMP